jgi:hypothetical protein
MLQWSPRQWACYFDEKNMGDLIAYATYAEGGFHIAWALETHVLAVEYLPMNSPAINVAIYEKRAAWVAAISKVDWIVEGCRSAAWPECPPELVAK